MLFPFPPDTVHFNPRSRDGSDAISPTSKTKHTISIHAPAKGATVDKMDDDLEEEISNHAPAKGATRPAELLYQRIPDFNPRSREGGDWQ